MSNSAPWSIKGVDKETRERMKQMAQEHGMTLADFLDDLMRAGASRTQESLNNITEESASMVSENIKQEQLKTEIVNTPITLEKNDHTENKPNAVLMSHSINMFSNQSKITDEKPHSESVPNTNILKTSLADAQKEQVDMPLKGIIPEEKLEEKLKVQEKLEEKLKVQEKPTKTKQHHNTQTQKSKPKSSTLKSTVKASHNTNENPSLFHKLTQKIGIETPIITQLSENNITDTIMRERQLRDFMRVQMTEMRDIMGAMFDKKIDKKVQELVHIIANNAGSDEIHKSLDSYVRTEDVLKKEDLHLQFNTFASEIEKNVKALIKAEIDTIYNSYQESLDASLQAQIQANIQYNIEEMQKFNHNILENIDKHLHNITQKTMSHNAFEMGDISAGDMAALSAFQDSTEVLASRIGRIEEVCLMLDNKLSQMQPYNLNHSDDLGFSESSDYVSYMQNMQQKLDNTIQAIPNYLNEALTNNQNKNEMKQIIHTLDILTKKFMGLEKTIQDSNDNNNYMSNSQAKVPSYVSHLDEYEEDDDNEMFENINKKSYVPEAVSDKKDILSDDWDDNENDIREIDDILEHNNDDYGYDVEENDDKDIRNFDRQAFKKGTRKNMANKINQRIQERDDNKFDLKNPKTQMILGGVALCAVIGAVIAVFS
jgi:hypothetical protein